MKKTYLKLIGLFIMTSITLTSCSNDDDSGINTNSDLSALYDKWWYDTNDFAADLYFHSDGQFEQKAIVLGTEFTTTGDWTWEDESSGIMKIGNLQGEGQLLTTMWFEIANLQESTMTIQFSADGIDFSTEIFYQDTDN